MSSLSNLKWSHWLTEGATSAKEQRSVQRLAAYPWYDLAAGPISYTFASDGSYARWMLRISASGVAEPDSLEVYLDGVKQAWTPRGDFDRAFYDYSDDSKGFSKGKHTLMVKQGFSKANSTAPIRQLCNLDLNEYGAEPTFRKEREGGMRERRMAKQKAYNSKLTFLSPHFIDMNETYISAYPTWDINGRKSYRPTNEGCLMRNMAERRFCSPCMEGMWLRFLKKVALIDGIETTCSALPSERSGTINVKASLVPLAHLRPEESRVAGETIDIRWFKNSVEQKEFAGLTEFYVVSSTVSASDSWKLEVKFSTPEIRKDKDGVTASSKTFKLPRC